MKWSHTIPLSLVLVVGIAAAALIAVAMFMTDQGEESLHLYRQLARTGTASPASSTMELQGRWMGMSLAPTDSVAARGVGIREAESGVVVVDLASQGGERARAAGLGLGDRLVAIDGKPVRNMADLYNVSRGVNPAVPTLLEVRRGDFPMTLVMPAMGAQLAGPRPEQEGGGAALPAAWAGGHVYCPRDGVVLPAAGAGPGLRCPRCQTPMQPYGRTWP